MPVVTWASGIQAGDIVRAVFVSKGREYEATGVVAGRRDVDRHLIVGATAIPLIVDPPWNLQRWEVIERAADPAAGGPSRLMRPRQLAVELTIDAREISEFEWPTERVIVANDRGATWIVENGWAHLVGAGSRAVPVHQLDCTLRVLAIAASISDRLSTSSAGSEQ